MSQDTVLCSRMGSGCGARMLLLVLSCFTRLATGGTLDSLNWHLPSHTLRSWRVLADGITLDHKLLHEFVDHMTITALRDVDEKTYIHIYTSIYTFLCMLLYRYVCMYVCT